MGQQLLSYLPAAILWGLGFFLAFQILQGGFDIIVYSSNTQSQWIGLTDPLSGSAVTQGYLLSNTLAGISARVFYSILFLFFAYKLTPKVSQECHGA